MGLSDCVATDVEQYVSIATELTSNRTLLYQTMKSISVARHKVFNNQGALDDFSRFLWTVGRPYASARKIGLL